MKKLNTYQAWVQIKETDPFILAECKAYSLAEAKKILTQNTFDNERVFKCKNNF